MFRKTLRCVHFIYTAKHKNSEMRYIKTFEAHRAADQPINEEFVGAIFNFFKNMAGKVANWINKVKGARQCQEIYKKYLGIMNQEIARKANIDLNIMATLQTDPKEIAKQEQEQKKQQQEQQKQPVKQNDSATWTAGSPINEAEEPKLTPEEIAEQNAKAQQAGQREGEQNKKIGIEALREKKKIIQQIIDLYKAKALKEMDNILKNMGGAAKNPKLSTIIDNFKDQFQIDMMNAQMAYLEKSGDKNEANKLATEIQRMNKELAAKWNLDRVEFAKLKVGDLTLNVGGMYRYNSAKGVKTIKVIRASEAPGEVIASYTYGDTKDKEQSFKAANIDTKFSPQVNGEYAYWSTTNNAGIRVKVLSAPDEKGMVDVQAGDNKFKVYAGALVGDGKTVDLSEMNPEEKKQGEAQGKEVQATEQK